MLVALAALVTLALWLALGLLREHFRRKHAAREAESLRPEVPKLGR